MAAPLLGIFFLYALPILPLLWLARIIYKRVFVTVNNDLRADHAHA